MNICAVSDLHGHLPDIPPCDLLLIAGDLCPDYSPHSLYGTQLQVRWLTTKFMDWVNAQPVPLVRATFGNHDFVHPNDLPYEMRQLFVKDAEQQPPFLGLRAWFSPWSNLFCNWAWMETPEELKVRYASIPDGMDIIVSHGPLYGYGDRSYVTEMNNEDPNVGSKELLAVVERVKPKLFICGHIHDGHGKYKHGETDVYNVSLVNERYQPVYEVTQIEL